MVDELTQESFQTGKAIVTVSVDLITAIADACKRSEQQNPGMSEEQKETLLGKVVDKVMSNYKETHGSLKGFNREGKDVTHIDVNDERTAELLEKACKKSHIPVDMKKVTRADGSITHTAFCEVKSIDQMAALLKMASEQVLEEQKEMTKTLVLYDDKGKEKSTLKDLSEVLGKETIDTYNTSDTRETSQSYGLNYQKLGRELMSQDRLALMDGGKCILQVRGVRPFFSDKVDITAHEMYKELSDFDKKNQFDIEKYVSEYGRPKFSKKDKFIELDLTGVKYPDDLVNFAMEEARMMKKAEQNEAAVLQ